MMEDNDIRKVVKDYIKSKYKEIETLKLTLEDYYKYKFVWFLFPKNEELKRECLRLIKSDDPDDLKFIIKLLRKIPKNVVDIYFDDLTPIEIKNEKLRKSLQKISWEIYFGGYRIKKYESQIKRAYFQLKSNHPEYDRSKDIQREQDFIHATECDIREFLRQHYSVKITDNRTFICPFHGEKNPSASIHKNRFYCFSCGLNGSAIDLIMKHEGKTFQEAVNILKFY